jgi:hypothetical protein
MYFPMVCRRVLAVVLVSLLFGLAFLPAYAQGPKNFKTEFEIATGTPGTNQTNPSLVVSSTGTVYVVWDEEIDGAREIYATRSSDQGKSFAPPIPVTNSNGQSNQTNPSIGLTSGGTLVVAWEDRTDGDSDVYVSKSSDPWGAFLTPAEASDAAGDSDQINPAIVIDSLGNIHVAWEDLRDDVDIRVSKAAVSTLSFGASVKVNDDTGTAWQHEPSIAVDSGDSIYITWYDRRDVDPYIYISKSTDGGLTYGANVLVDDAGGPQFEPSIDIVSNRVYVVWQDGRSGLGRDIYFTSGDVSTLTFTGSIILNSGTTSTNQREPDLSVETGGEVHVVWHDFRDLVHDIYYAHSDDGGVNFADQKANKAQGDSILEKATPKVVGIDGAVFVVWEDEELNDARIMITSSGEIGDGGNGGENGDTSTDSLSWILILVIVLVLVIVVSIVIFLSRRKKETQ